MVKSLSAGNRVMVSVKRFLEKKLRLKINEKKSKVVPVEECGFLGFVFVNGKIRWSDKSFLEFKRRLRLFTGRSWFVSMEYRYKKLAEYIRGWMNYYGISEYYRPIPGIDEWLRRRIRMCYWKQWRYTRTKVRNLLKLGSFKREAISTALSRRGPWPGNLNEPPYADPLVGWCGGWGIKTPGYPIEILWFIENSQTTFWTIFQEE